MVPWQEKQAGPRGDGARPEVASSCEGDGLGATGWPVKWVGVRRWRCESPGRKGRSLLRGRDVVLPTGVSRGRLGIAITGLRHRQRP